MVMQAGRRSVSDAIWVAKEQVLQGCGLICARGYVLGTAGNISVRVADDALFVITPTTLPYDEMTAEDLVVADMAGNIVAGNRQPSMEISLHRSILLTRPDVRCIVHTHSKFATAASSMRDVNEVPVIDIETAIYIGGDIAIAPFAPPGSEDLARNVTRSLGDLAGVLMESHGAISVGQTMREALTAGDIIERNCEMFLLIRAAGEAKPLPRGPLRDLCEYSRMKRGLHS